MSTPLLQVEDLSVEFVQEGVSSRALNRVSLTVNKGELVAVVGESGSGKSVTSLSTLRLVPSPPAQYTSGHIYFTQAQGSSDLLQATAVQMQQLRGNRIAMIFQEPMTSLNPVHTCGRQVSEAILQHQSLTRQQAKARTLQLFKTVQLPEPERIFKSYPHQISGGQKQRIMIAMAMSCQPDLLICDEPTTALDVTVQKNILLLIKELQLEKQMGVLFITHDLAVVSEIADRIVVMYKGNVVEQGPAQQIFTQPRHPYTQALLACRPALYPKGRRLPVVSDFMPQESAHRTPVPESTPGHPQDTGSPLITVQHLNVWYTRSRNFLGRPTAVTKAVNDVSFEIFEGETLGLVGESGCGKSTLGRTLLRLIEPTAGEIFFKGQSLLHLDHKALTAKRRQMQMIFQDPYSSLNPRKTVGAAIAEVLQVHGIGYSAWDRKNMVIDLLHKVNLLPEHYNRYPHEFSGGQRQRIVIARALALKPSFLVCDESVSALDVSVQAQVLNLLNDLKKEFRFTAVFISHDLSVVRYISDRIMVMNKGRIEEIGPAEQVYHHPASPYTQQLLAAAPAIAR